MGCWVESKGEQGKREEQPVNKRVKVRLCDGTERPREGKINSYAD